METFRTTTCTQHGHPEVTIQLHAPVPIPKIETMLLQYFEQAVASGTKFHAGETVQLGWSTLKLIDRTDGTLGVEELNFDNLPQWRESVSTTLLDTWRQQQVLTSVGLDDGGKTPSELSNAVVCKQWRETVEFLLSRVEPKDDEDSGWFIGCTDPEHDHESTDSLEMTQLINVAAFTPPLVQFLALPPECEVLVRGPGRIQAQVWKGKDELRPKPGSYLEALGAPN